MITNLIFKRQVTVMGVTKVVTRILPVDIPQINTEEGWMLSGHTDRIETTEDMYVHRLAPTVTDEQLSQESYNVSSEPTKSEDTSKFESNVSGTAKLVRSKGVIKIVARRGKTTYNQTTPNSVCINDFTKNEFFRNCREYFGSSGCFEFSIQDKPYDYWNEVIDKEYQRQKKLI